MLLLRRSQINGFGPLAKGAVSKSSQSRKLISPIDKTSYLARQRTVRHKPSDNEGEPRIPVKTFMSQPIAVHWGCAGHE